MLSADQADYLKLAKSIASGELRLMCRSMSLAPARSNDPDAAQLRGSGMIESTPGGGLRYRLVYDGQLPLTHWAGNSRPAHVEAIGELFRLVAVDSRGREWRSTPVRAKFSRGGPPYGPAEVVEPIDGIIYREPSPRSTDPSLKVFCPQRPSLLPVMPNWTQVVHSRDGKEQRFESRADHVQYTAEECSVHLETAPEDALFGEVVPLRGGMVPLGFEQRLMDAIALIAGQRVAPSLCLRTQGGHRDWQISRGFYRDPLGLIRPPIIQSHRHRGDDIWALAALYQDTIAREWPDVFGARDPLSEAVAQVNVGSQGTLLSALLSLAIGIEMTGNAIRLRDRYTPDKKEVDLEGAIAQLRNWNTDDKDSRAFAIKRLSDLKGPDFASALFKFADAHEIDHAVIKTWKRLRPQLAHGRVDRSTDHSVVQSDIDSYYTLLGLLYRLIADFVGYDGNLVDYSQPDWGLGPDFV